LQLLLYGLEILRTSVKMEFFNGIERIADIDADTDVSNWVSYVRHAAGFTGFYGFVRGVGFVVVCWYRR